MAFAYLIKGDGIAVNRVAASLAQLPASAELSRPSQWVQKPRFYRAPAFGGNV